VKQINPHNLTKQQEILLLAIAGSNIFSNFYLSGGTALSAFYLRHRYSEDLDFFSIEEIDSLVDIATNKLFTIAQKPRSRDFIDLYFILKSTHITLNNLYFNAKTKFDWHIDPLQLLSRFTQIDESDFSMLYSPIKLDVVKTFFEQRFQDFSNLILKK